MGRACSKVVPQEITSPSSLQYVNSSTTQMPATPEVLEDLINRLSPETGPLKFLTNRLQLKIQEIEVGKSNIETKPPHEQIFTPPALTNGFEFYVCIYELRVKGLCQEVFSSTSGGGAGAPVAQPGRSTRVLHRSSPGSTTVVTAEYVALVSWDNNSQIIRTSFERSDGTGCVTFPGHWSFNWKFASNRLVAMKDRYLLIALFKIEHLRNASLIGYSVIDILSITVGPIHHDFSLNRWQLGSGGPSPRVQFECRLTQICKLSCVPVEVKITVNDAQVEDLRSPDEKTPQNSTKVSALPTSQATTCVPKTHGTSNTLTTDSIPPRSKSVSNLGPTKAQDATDIAKAASHIKRETALSLQKKASAIAEVDALDGPTQNHKTDDEKCLIKAEWKVDIGVTGIPNVVPSSSTWTSVTVAPYWLALDDSCRDPDDKMRITPVATTNDITNDTSLTDVLKGSASYGFATGSPTNTSSRRGRITSDAGGPLDYRRKNGDDERELVDGMAPRNKYQELYAEAARKCQNVTSEPFSRIALTSASCLKPFYLLTTSEGIRQFYLLVRLWTKPLGVGPAKLYGETWVPFFKLFDADIVPCRSFLDVSFTETLWNDGRNVGQISATLVFQDIPVLRQMFAGVSTETGYRRLISPGIQPIAVELESSLMVPEISQLTTLTEELHRHWMKTNVIHAEKVKEVMGSPRAGTRHLNMTEISEKLIELLSSTSSSAGTFASPMFQYPSIGSLIEGQKALLDLGCHILDSQDFLPWSLRGVLGNIVILILRRGELEIGNILPTFTKEMSRAELRKLLHQRNGDIWHLDQRMRISAAYVDFLFKLLEAANNKMMSEAMFESQRKQIASYYAILFNRLPAFRSKVLQVVLSSEEREMYINEWRGIDFTLDKASLLQRDEWSKRPWPGLYELQLNLDWSSLYENLAEYHYLLEDPGEDDSNSAEEFIYEDPVTRVERIFDKQPDALNWLNPRSITFHMFLNSWIRMTWAQLDYSQQRKLAGRTELESSKPKGSVSRAALGNLRWDLIPGYATLLKAFLLELRERPVAKFPDALLNCSATLLVNDRLLAVFIRIVLTRTSVYSREQVFAAFNYLDFWFEVFSLKNQSLPLTMDYRLLSKAIDGVINSDLALQIAKTIWFLYKRMDVFLGQKSMLKILVELLLFKHFYKICENARRLVAKNTQNSADIPCVSIEERLVSMQSFISPLQILWSYILVTENVRKIGITPVYPEKFATGSLRKLIGQPLPAYQKHASAILMWNIPAVLSTMQPPSTPLKPPSSAGGAETPNIEEFSGSNRKTQASPSKEGRSWIIRRPGGFKFRKRRSVREADDFDQEDEVLQDPTGVDDVPVFEYEPPEQYLPTPPPITKLMQPYIQHILAEFASEVEQYKLWVISGKSEVPPMHIPASPLDTNVDVPLEED